MPESLFSLELVVESLENLSSFCHLPAVAFRLLDFPTLIIHHIPPQTAENIKSKLKLESSWKPPSLEELKDRFGNYQIHKGKSCLFRMHHQELFSLLANTPLYVLLIDVWPDKPKLVGSTSVPLKNCMAKINQDIMNRGVANPSVHGHSGRFDLFNLMGSKIGVIALSLRILSLGGTLIPHIPEASIMNREIDDTQVCEPERKTAEKMLKDITVAPPEEDVVEEDIKKGMEENHNLLDYPLECEKIPKCDHETQTNYEIPRQTKISKKIPQFDSEDNEGIVVTNTVCPPPLFYNSLSHPQKPLQKKTHNHENRYSPRENFQIYHNSDFIEVQAPSKEVQTQGIDSATCNEIQLSKQRNSENHVAGCKDHNLPLLNALLQELNVLGVGEKLHGNGLINIQQYSQRFASEQSIANEVHPDVQVPEKEPEKKNKSVTQQPRRTGKKAVSILGVQNKAKCKNRYLTYGTTRAQQMRLERNRALLGKDGTKCEACTTVTRNNETARLKPVIPKQGKKHSTLSFTRCKPVEDVRPMVASVEVQTEETYEGLLSVEVQTNEKQIFPKPKKRPNREGKSKKVLGKTFPKEFPEVSTDLSRVFSPDESVPSFTSQNSMDIFLPTAEDESDQASERDSLKSGRNEDDKQPVTTNNRYGVTGIISPGSPQVIQTDAGYTSYGIQDSEVLVVEDTMNREESSPSSFHSTKSANSQKSASSVVRKPPIAKPRSRSFDRGSPTHLDPDQPILSARSPSVSRTSKLIRQTVIEREENFSDEYDSDSQHVGRNLSELKVHKHGSISDDPSRVSTPVMRRSSVTSIDSEYRKPRTISQLSVRDYSEDFCSAESGSESEKEGSIEDSLEVEQRKK